MTVFSEMQELRLDVIKPLISKKTTALEFGAFTKPTFLNKHIKKLSVADYYTTEELREQVTNYGGDPDEVIDVDYVLRDQSIGDALDGAKFDIIIAHHVLEHLVDPFRWMKEMEEFLNPGGKLFISLPDKKYSFDRFRSDTSLPHFIHDFINGGEHSLSEHCIDAALFYDYEYSGAENIGRGRFDKDFLAGTQNSYHPGMHVHVFQMEMFADYILKPFLGLGFINYKLIGYAENRKYGEFSFVLEKSETPTEYDEADVYQNAYDAILAEEEVTS